ncbi:MAG: VWA domain-containing protein [Sandaracinaceae bacterium]
MRVARRAGLRVSPAETLDAIEAASLVGLASKDDLRAALSASLVKRIDDQPLFERIFDRFFEVGSRSGLSQRLAESGATDAELADLMRRIAAGQVAGGGGALAALMQGGAEEDERLFAAMERAGVRGMVSPMQVGLFSLRTLEELGVPAVERDLDAIGDALDPDGALGLIPLLSRQLDALRRRVRAEVREAFDRNNPELAAQSRAARLETAALAALTKEEAPLVQREVERLARALKDRMERARRRQRRGRLDIRATITESVRTQGIPVRLRWRKRRRDRPELVVLCDISDSVRAAARFLLVLVYAMQEAFRKTRSFVFVRDVGEVTRLFADRPIDDALAAAFLGDAVPVGASSDYGRVLTQMVDRHLDAIGPKTTVVILGDGRTNYLDPGLDALRLIEARAARVVWLNPEPRASWGFGDSEMLRYARHADFAETVRTLRDLRAAVGRLVRQLTR